MHRYVTRECIFKVVAVSENQLESVLELYGSNELISLSSSIGQIIKYNTCEISICFNNSNEDTTDLLREKHR